MRDIVIMITHPLGIHVSYWVLTIVLLAGAYLLMQRADEKMHRGQRLVAVGLLWIAISSLIVGHGESVAIAAAQAKTTVAPSLIGTPHRVQAPDPQFSAPGSELPWYAHYWIHLMGGVLLMGAGLVLDQRAKHGY